MSAPKRALKMIAIAIAAFIAFGTTDAIGQQTQSPRSYLRDRSPVAIVLLEPGSNNDGVRLLRRASKRPHDVIVVSRNHLEGRLVALAVLELQRQRKARGIVPQGDVSVSITAGDQSPNPYVNEAPIWIAKLKELQATNLSGFGSVPYLILYLPNKEPALAANK